MVESLSSQKSIKSQARPDDLTDLTDFIDPKTLQTQIVIGTSLLCSPIKNHPFDLVIFLNADFGLNIPDYTSAEKNFYFLYETFMKHQTKHFIVQSFNPNHYSIRNACKLDKE
ncbi:MAG: hypothetical protein WCG98_02140 [bacterium]